MRGGASAPTRVANRAREAILPDPPGSRAEFAPRRSLPVQRLW